MSATEWKYAGKRVKASSGRVAQLYRYRFVMGSPPRDEVERFTHGLWMPVRVLNSRSVVDDIARGDLVELPASVWEKPEPFKGCETVIVFEAPFVPELVRRMHELGAARAMPDETFLISQSKFVLGAEEWWVSEESEPDGQDYTSWMNGVVEAAQKKTSALIRDAQSRCATPVKMRVSAATWESEVLHGVERAAESALVQIKREEEAEAERQRVQRELLTKGPTVGLDDSNFAKAFQARFGKGKK